MAKTASMYLRIDPQVKSDVEAIYAEYGMSITDAINVFLYTSRKMGGLPFDLRPAPNAETLKAIREAQKSVAGSQYSEEEILADVMRTRYGEQTP